MPTAFEQPTAKAHVQTSSQIPQWATFFAVAYMVQGMSQYSNILYQPVNFFFKEVHGYGADKLAHLSFVLIFPWYFKPVYGIISDFFPLGGYRRRSYLLIISLLTAGTYIWFGVPGLRDKEAILLALVVTSFGAAVSDVVVDALMVKNGQATGRIKLFQGLQWISVTTAAFFAALIGGWLCENARDDPGLALHQAARIAIAGPMILFVASWLLVKESKSRFSRASFKRRISGIVEAVRSKPLWGAGLFIFAFWFQPGLNSPFYIHATTKFSISEFEYGSAGAWGQLGYILGALSFTLYLGRKFSTRQCAVFSIIIYSAATLSYLFFHDYSSLQMCNIAIAFAWMISTLTLLSLAAEVCPKGVEGFTFAGLMAISNLSYRYSEKIGGTLYENTFDRDITPLIWVSAGATALAVFFIPLLPRANKQG